MIEHDLLVTQYALVAFWGLATIAWANVRGRDPRLRAATSLWGLAIVTTAVIRGVRARLSDVTHEAALAHEHARVVNAVLMSLLALVGGVTWLRFKEPGRVLVIQGLFLTAFDLTWAAIYHVVHRP